MIRVSSPGSFERTRRFLERARSRELFSALEPLGRRGVDALSAATPRASGKTAGSWKYRIERNGRGVAIYWYNTNVNQGAQIAVLIQHGHGTGTGGFVAGRDYINPAMRPVFDEIADEVWRKVTSA
jgi:hypothetical protein